MGIGDLIRKYVKMLSLEESVLRTRMEQSFYNTASEDPMETAFQSFDVQTIPENRCAFYDAMRKSRRF